MHARHKGADNGLKYGLHVGVPYLAQCAGSHMLYQQLLVWMSACSAGQGSLVSNVQVQEQLCMVDVDPQVCRLTVVAHVLVTLAALQKRRLLRSVDVT